MRIRAGIIGAAIMGLASNATAFTTLYSGMAVPGSHNGWSTATSMVAMADHVWVCTQNLASANGTFKFAANGGWEDQWGSAASIQRIPAVASASVAGEQADPLSYFNFAPGNYRFTFNEITLECTIEWVEAAPLPIPVFTNLALVGDFNDWTTNANCQLTNYPAPNTNLWGGNFVLESDTAFQFAPNGDTNNAWGAPRSTVVIAPTNGSTCGHSDFLLAGVNSGTYRFTLNASNNQFSVALVAAQSFNAMTVQGSFIATNLPPPNMVRVEGTSLWESDHHITNTAAISVRFAASTSFTWGVTNGTPAFALPASGTMVLAATNFATVSVATPGRYRITFNHLTGAFAFQRLYVDTSVGTNANLLKNPGFELTTESGGGDAVNWPYHYQAWPHDVARGAPPHSGNWCGAIHGAYMTGWSDYGSFAQDVPVTTGRTYQVAAWFRATPGWSAGTMQIKVEWQDVNSNAAGETAVNIPSLSTDWAKYSVEATAPTNATRAHVVFLCASAQTSGGIMYVDDAEMRIVAGRTQNFDTWGSLASFGPYSPDWSITSGKTIWNVAPPPPPIDVFISQYVEGTGNNKAIEIYNGLTSNLNLAAQNYVLQQYDNGATNPSVSIALSGTIPAGNALVVGRPGTPPAYAPDAAISGLPNLFTNRYVTFNGDDVVVLRQGGTNGTVKDRVGQVGTNATGSIWSRSTKDHTLTRKSTILTGTLGNVAASFPLATEWDVSTNNAFAGLGAHEVSFIDANEPYTPGGYSLLMNTNATLMSGELPGGIGDVSFWYRTESLNPPVTMSLESAPSETGPWVTNATLANVARSYFINYVVAVNRPDHLYWRIRQTDGGTNRFRIDEIEASAYSAVRRLEDFNAWTDPAYGYEGNYSRYSWAISNASIATTAGVSTTRAALLSSPNGTVTSPAFESGAGEVEFWAKAADAGTTNYLILLASTDGGANWTTQGTSFAVTTGATFTAWLYFTNVGAQVRVAFDPAKTSGDTYVDNVEVREPALYRSQNFNGWPQRSSYTNESYQGWIISNCSVVATNAYESQSARLNSTLGSYVRSPYLPGGIGTLSFVASRWSSNETFNLAVQISSNASIWTTIANVAPTSTAYESYSMYVGSSNQYYVRLYHDTGSGRAMVDEIACGVYQPRPQIIATPGLDPAAPVVNEPMTVIADVVTRYGASILSVTSFYRIVSTNNPWTTNGMSVVEPGSYAATSSIPGQAVGGTMISYYVQVWYAGLGADTNSAGYATNVYTSAICTNWVATVDVGDVWINEIFYAPYGPTEPYEYNYICLTSDPCTFFSPDLVDILMVTNGACHEFIELCGVEGVDLSGWSIELCFGSQSDIATHSNQPAYARYFIPSNTVFTNAVNGYGFYVLGDQELATNAPIDLHLTNALHQPPPSYAVPIWPKDHIYDGVGVIRLLDQFGNEFYSLSYRGFASGADRIPQNQAFTTETNSISLTYQGDTYLNFDWEMRTPTAGSANAGQVLVERVEGSNVYAIAWHVQAEHVVPANTNLVAPFDMLNPWPPAHYDDISVYYGFTNSAYPSAAGTLYHRGTAAGAWSEAAMSIRDGSADAAGRAYVWATIPHHTYERLQTIQYVIAVDPNKTGAENSYLGSGPGSNNVSTIYTNLAAAQVSPFSYVIPIADRIWVTNLLVGATNTTMWTDGNDPEDPLVNFYVRVSTNLLQPTHLWTVTNHVKSTNIYGQWTFNVRKTTNAGPKLYYLIQPLWP